MNIAIDARTYFLRSGSGRYTRGLVDALVENYPDDFFTVLISNHKTTDDFPLSSPNLRLEVSQAALNSKAEEEEHLVSELKSINPDIVFFPFFILPKGVSQPSVCSILDLTFIRHKEKHLQTNIEYLDSYLPQTLEFAEIIVTISDYVRQDVLDYAYTSGIELSSDRVHRIYPGVDYQYTFQADQPVLKDRLSSKPYFLYAGSIEARKNVDGIIRAYGRICSTVEQDLIIVGIERWGADVVKQAMAELQYPERVIFTGYLEDFQLAGAYRGATALVYPSFSEGFGLPVIEAYASGTPVITSNTTSLKEIGGAAQLVNPDSVSEIAAAMKRVADDKGLRDSMREAGLQQAKKYSWHGAAEQLRKVFEAVVSNTSDGGRHGRI